MSFEIMANNEVFSRAVWTYDAEGVARLQLEGNSLCYNNLAKLFRDVF